MSKSQKRAFTRNVCQGLKVQLILLTCYYPLVIISVQGILNTWRRCGPPMWEQCLCSAVYSGACSSVTFPYTTSCCQMVLPFSVPYFHILHHFQYIYTIPTFPYVASFVPIFVPFSSYIVVFLKLFHMFTCTAFVQTSLSFTMQHVHSSSFV